MTKKGLFFTIFIILLITLSAVLFSCVFCLKNQQVKIIDNSAILIDNSDIIETAGLKSRQPIFLLNKEQAIANIEHKYANIKVVQIKTTGLTSIEICVRSRHKTFYVEDNEKYYILDEDLKVLEIVEDITNTAAPNLIKININLNIAENAKVCDFLGSNSQKKVIYSLYSSMINVATKKVEDKEVYFDRVDVINTIKQVEIQNFETFNKLLITTNYGVLLDVEKPEKDLEKKINICFSTIKMFIQEENNQEKSGTIKLYYDLDNKLNCVYVAE